MTDPGRPLAGKTITVNPLVKTRRAFEQVRHWLEGEVAAAAAGEPDKFASWRAEFSAIQAHVENTSAQRIALVGTTGAGKSSFLNAVLEQELLPVGVMEPCTAFVTRVGYAAGNSFKVRIQYVTEDEWQADLRSLVECLAPGEGTDGESRAVLLAAKKRVQAVTGLDLSGEVDSTVIANAPLPAAARRVFDAGSTEPLEFLAASEMLAHLRKLIRGGSPLWPLIKEVSIVGPYPCLAGGLELVDLPGLNDANEARVEVTREYLRSSPYVWLMFSMVRGLTQDIRQVLEEEKLLRTLVLAGTYDALSLIGTKADEVDVNAAPQLGLPDNCELPELIREYRRQTETAARAQLEEMVRGLTVAGDDPKTLQRMLNLARKAEVHATSANAYIRLKGFSRLRRDYGIENVAETGIPGIHELLQRIARNTGADARANMALDRLNKLKEEITLFFRAGTGGGGEAVPRAVARLQTELGKCRSQIDWARATAGGQLEAQRSAFMAKMDRLLAASVQEVQQACQQWRPIAWATLRAIVTRNGVFRSPSSGKNYDLNADLIDPFMSQLPLTWERYFTDELHGVVSGFSIRVCEAGRYFAGQTETITELLLDTSDDLLASQLKWLGEKVALLVTESDAQLQHAISHQRRQLVETLMASAKDCMQPAYTAAKHESGTGMKARILQRLESTALKSAEPVYGTIQRDILEGINGLEAIILHLLDRLAEAALQQAKTVAHNAATGANGTVPRNIAALIESAPSLS